MTGHADSDALAGRGDRQRTCARAPGPPDVMPSTVPVEISAVVPVYRSAAILPELYRRLVRRPR